MKKTWILGGVVVIIGVVAFSFWFFSDQRLLQECLHKGMNDDGSCRVSSSCNIKISFSMGEYKDIGDYECYFSSTEVFHPDGAEICQGIIDCEKKPQQSDLETQLLDECLREGSEEDGSCRISTCENISKLWGKLRIINDYKCEFYSTEELPTPGFEGEFCRGIVQCDKDS